VKAGADQEEDKEEGNKNMIDIITILIALAFLAVFLKPIIGGGDEIDDSFSGISLLLLVLGIAIYFYAIALIDVFFQSALGMPLSTRLIFEVLFPCAIIYRVAKSMLNFVAILSKTTVTLIAGCSAFVMFVSVTYGQMNIVTLFFTFIEELFSFFAGLFANKLAEVSFGVFVAGVVIITFGIFFETVAVILTSEILKNA